MNQHDSPPVWRFASAMPGIVWPAIPDNARSTALALLFQLEASQWLPARRLEELQSNQIEIVLKHAHATVPYYREQWVGVYDPGSALSPARFAELPLLTRRQLQDNFEALRSGGTPPAHGNIGEVRSSGSTGMPVRVLKTGLAMLFWNVLTLRDHLWHRRDLAGKLAAIRHTSGPPEQTNWGQATEGLVATGPSVLMGVHSGVEEQLRWLEQQQPEYLLIYPSLVAELAKRSLEYANSGASRLRRLREVRTFAETLHPDVRELCRQAWSVPVTDVYSTNETGYLALQCPQHEHYHVQSEDVLVEILDPNGRPCAPGEVGRVVVTTLHNFAMPLIRYDIGDYAEAGGPCPCGRGLPVIRRIVGRVRNMLVTASGERYWPGLGFRAIREIAPVIQYQVVQKDYERIEVRLVTAAPLTVEQADILREQFLARLVPGLSVELVYCDSIPRSAGGKYEEFMSEIAR